MMRKQMTFIGFCMVAVALAIFLQSCATPGKQAHEPEGTLLTHSELMALYSVPRQAEFANSRGISAITYAPDGGQTLKKGSFSDTGTYRIDDNKICGTWKKIRNGKEACSMLYKIGDGKYRVDYTDGREAGTLIFK